MADTSARERLHTGSRDVIKAMTYKNYKATSLLGAKIFKTKMILVMSAIIYLFLGNRSLIRGFTVLWRKFVGNHVI